MQYASRSAFIVLGFAETLNIVQNVGSDGFSAEER